MQTPRMTIIMDISFPKDPQSWEISGLYLLHLSSDDVDCRSTIIPSIIPTHIRSTPTDTWRRISHIPTDKAIPPSDGVAESVLVSKSPNNPSSSPSPASSGASTSRKHVT